MAAEDRLLASARAHLVGGPLPAEELARRLYGVAGPVEPWLPMLRRLLAGREGFERGPDGAWSLRARPERAPLLLAGRVSGARGGRLVALALASRDSPGVVWRWSFRGERRAPRYLGDVAPAGDDPDGESRSFAESASWILELVSGRELVALDAQLPLALAHELELCDLPAPEGPVLVAGAGEWARDGRKRRMTQLRADLGLPPEAADPLGGELEALALLLRRAEAPPPVAAPPRRPGELRAQVASFPRAPGIYVFRGGGGEALYVGSASDLRRRVLSYFGEQIALTRELRGLLERAAFVECVPLGTHLETLLEEATLIAELKPPYNVQRKVSARPVWLRVGAEPGGNVAQVASSPRRDAALYLGPLPNRSAVHSAAGALAALWGLRRRGGSGRVAPESLARLDELSRLLTDSESFCAELRVRFHREAPRLTPRVRAKLAAEVERTERAALGGELRPVDDAARSALVARRDEQEGLLYLLLVRELRPIACARSSLNDPRSVSRAALELLTASCPPQASPPPPTGQVAMLPELSLSQEPLPESAELPEASESAALAARWLHAHRDDPWVFPLMPEPAATAAALLAALAAVGTPEAASRGGDEAWRPLRVKKSHRRCAPGACQ